MEAKTFQATICLGLKEGYDGIQHSISEVIETCKSYCTKVHLCVTVTPTHFCYVDGDEEGCFVGLIQYPRFIESEQIIKEKAINLAELLKETYHQNRVSIIFPDVTHML